MKEQSKIKNQKSKIFMLVGLAMLLTLTVQVVWPLTIVRADSVTIVTNCTDAGLRTAVTAGGIITFNCGITTITLGSTLTVNKAVTIDGGGKITLTGNYISLDAQNNLTLQNITLNKVRVKNSNSTVSVINSTIANNVCGGVAKTDVGCGILNSGDLILVNSIVATNTSSGGDGGGIANQKGTVTLIQSTISNNSADRGGGISNLYGSLTIKNSKFLNNIASGTNAIGGGLFSNESSGGVYIYDSTFDGNQASRGGGVTFWGGVSAKSLTVKGSTFTNNQGKASSGFGPGGLEISQGTLVMENCTFTANSGWNPGAIFIDPFTTTATIINSTIANNSSTSGNVGGIQRKSGSSSLTVHNIILANNTPQNCNTDVPFAIDGGGNVQSSSGCAGTVGDSKLSSLANNGGSTETMALKTGSAAIGAGSGCPTTDQRGYSRAGCDSGAYQVNSTPPQTPTLTNMAFTPPSAGDPVYELTATGSNFTAQSVVMWNGQALPTRYNSATELMAYIPLASYSQPGIVPVTVSTGGAGSTAQEIRIGTELNQISLVKPTTAGKIDTFYLFSASISPTTVSAPLTYTWQATGEAITQTTALSNTASFKWRLPGVYTVMVTAANPLGVVTKTELITINVPPVGLMISGETNGETYKDYDFTAVISPDNTTMPMTYTWQATNLPTIIYTSSNLSENKTFNWATAGVKVVSVIAENGWGKLTQTHSITIVQIALAVNLDGSSAVGKVEHSYFFTASVLPSNTPKPITFTWQATDQTEVVKSSGLTQTISFTWTTAGLKIVTVTAQGSAGTNSATQTIAIYVPPNEGGVAIGTGTGSGTQTGATNTPYTFTVSPDPSTSQPITYTWEAVGQKKVVTQGETMPFSWTIPGVKAITLTVENPAGAVTKYYSITIYIPPSGVTIGGPGEGEVANGGLSPNGGKTSTPYTFTVATAPTTSQPVTYTWQATDQSPLVTSTGELPFSWNKPGLKFITVTVTNLSGISVTQSYSITINVPPNTMTISGPIVGSLDNSYTFSALLKPITSTQPMTYIWEATDHDITETVGLNNRQLFSWTVIGTKDITVTARNEWGTVVATHSITITLIVPLSDVTLEGATLGEMATIYRFTATVVPELTTPPITYTWEAVGQKKVVTQSNTMPFSWSTTGVKVITLTVENSVGKITQLYSVTIIVPLLGLSISGPTSAILNSSSLFTATISPLTATLPISTTWFPEPTAGQGTAVVSYTWTISGTQLITVTASNIYGGLVTATHSLTITENLLPSGPPQIYLPIILKK